MKIAYVLSGGGAKGAFQVGVMKKLHEQGIVPNVIYGTSVGALNAAGYSHTGMDGLEKQWLGVTGRQWYRPWSPSPDVLNFNWSMLLMCADGIYNTKPLKAHLLEICKLDANCEAVAVRVSLNTGAVDYVSNRQVSAEDFAAAAEGSSAIPGIMSPVGEWVDGGVREVVAIRKAIADGADKVYAILANPLVENPTELYDVAAQTRFLKFLNVAYRSIDGVMEHEIFASNAAYCFQNTSSIPIEVYAPKIVPCSTLDFDPVKIRANIEMGYNAVPIEKLPEIGK